MAKITVEALMSGCSLPAAKRVRIGKICPLESRTPGGDMFQRTIHVETDLGDFNFRIEAPDQKDLMVEVLNPITSI